MSLRPALLRMAAGVRKTLEEVYGSPRGECYRWSNYIACALLEDDPSREVWMSTGSLSIGSRRLHHAWVEHEGWVVDITADQFNGISRRRIPAVWVIRAASFPGLHLPSRRRLVRHP